MEKIKGFDINGSVKSLDHFESLIEESKIEGKPINLYCVYALGSHSRIVRFQLSGKTYITQEGAIKEIVVYYPPSDNLDPDTQIYALDHNIIQNKYNNHAVFESKLLADKYLKACMASDELNRMFQKHFSGRINKKN